MVSSVTSLRLLPVAQRPAPAPQSPSGLQTDRLTGLPAAGTGAQRATTLSRPDQFQASSQANRLNNLLWSWRVLGGLLGTEQAKGPDLAGLQQALQAARERSQQIEQREGILNTLKSSALKGAEDLVRWAFGLQADGAPMQVQLEPDMGGALASVSYTYDQHGRMKNMIMHVSVSQFTPDTSSNGTNDHVIENDRIIAHEMTHAVMGRNMDVSQLPNWFMEGTAEYVAGGAERVALSLRQFSPQGLLNRVLQPWSGDSSQYAASYLAIRYLDVATQEGGGIKAIMAHLKAGDSLDQAIAGVSGGRYAGESDFLLAFARKGEGVAWMRSIDLSGKDPGSIKAGVASREVVPDGGKPTNQPLQGFRISWPSPIAGIDWSSLIPGGGLFGGNGVGGWLGAPDHAAYRRAQQAFNRVQMAQ